MPGPFSVLKGLGFKPTEDNAWTRHPIKVWGEGPAHARRYTVAVYARVPRNPKAREPWKPWAAAWDYLPVARENLPARALVPGMLPAMAPATLGACS